LSISYESTPLIHSPSKDTYSCPGNLVNTILVFLSFQLVEIPARIPARPRTRSGWPGRTPSPASGSPWSGGTAVLGQDG